MYYTESFRYAILVYDFDPCTGAISNRLPFATLDSNSGGYWYVNAAQNGSRYQSFTLVPVHASPNPSSSSNFQLIFDDVLKEYERRTKKNLRTHPLAAQLQQCNSPSSILNVLQQQVQKLNQSQRRNERWTRWLDPAVKVLHAFSETLGKVVTLVLCLSL